MTGRCRGIAELAGAPHCLLHPTDAARLGVTDRVLVALATDSGSIVLQARLSDDTVPGQVLVPRGFDTVPVSALVRWPATETRVEVRPLVPAPAGGTP